jgi:two-component system sensor histidine kinase DegS
VTDGPDLVRKLIDQEHRVVAEGKELVLLIDSTQSEVNRLRAREEQAQTRLRDVRENPGNFQRDDVFKAYEEYSAAAQRRVSMEGQLAALQSKKKLVERVRTLLQETAEAAQEIQHALPSGSAEDGPAPAAPVDDGRLLQAVVETQEEERRRIARQVHDGPAQTLSNVILQTEISERLFEIDPQRSRAELAALRELVNRTLQELRAFIFELRPMILDDLGLVPTMRRYVQTLIDKYRVRLDFSAMGRDRRLVSDDEVAIFRLIQDSLVERLERGEAKGIQLSMDWKGEHLEVVIRSDGKELPPDAELASGLRRSERLDLLKGEAALEQRADGTSVLTMRVPLRQAQSVS